MFRTLFRAVAHVGLLALIVGLMALTPSPATAAPPGPVTRAGATPAEKTLPGADAHPKCKKGKKAAQSKKCKKKKKKKKVPVGERIVRTAAAQAGDRYEYGAAGPNAFDCSGLTMFAHARNKKRLPRTSSAQREATRHIRARNARRGDLVFFHGSSGVYHVGIYAGKHQIWHAPSTGSVVRRERIWTSEVSYGRVR